MPCGVVLFQARQELIEQSVELAGVVDKKRVPGVVKKFKFRAGNALMHLLKLGQQSLVCADNRGWLVDFSKCRTFDRPI